MYDNFNHKFVHIAILLISIIAAGCDSDSEPPLADNNPTPTPSPGEMTLFMYMPWSETLTYNLRNNIADMQQSLNSASEGKNVIAFICTSETEARMLRLTASGQELLKQYSAPDITTSTGIANILLDVKEYAPAASYAMIIGCHGSGWLPKGALDTGGISSKFTDYTENSIWPLTRYYGGLSASWQVDVSELADAITIAGMHMSYMLFDACYMGGIETAYAFRNVTDIFVSSATEIMGVGMPYGMIGRDLLDGKNVDWDAVCNKVLARFNDYAYPYVTLSAVRCSALEELAETMKQINQTCEWHENNIAQLQELGGFKINSTYHRLFYDFLQFSTILSSENANAQERMRNALQRAVITKVNTASYYVAYVGAFGLPEFCGLSTSQPATTSIASQWHATEWATATSGSGTVH